MDTFTRSKIADSLSPAELDMVYKAFGLDLLDDSPAYYTEADLLKEVEWEVGLVTGSHLWDAMWRFGIVIDNDTALVTESLAGYWNPEGSLRCRADYYVPNDYDTEVSLIDLDHPPMEDVAWDSKAA